MSSNTTPGYRPATWTADEFIPEPVAHTPAHTPDPAEPGSYELYQVIYKAVRPHHEAFLAMYHAIVAAWPHVYGPGAPSGPQPST